MAIQFADDASVPAAADLGKVHFIGIGGAGMSGLARILLARGIAVSGSDARESATVTALRDLGATVFIGHAADQIAGASTVVLSTAVRENNPELLAAREAGLLVLHRSQALAALMRGLRGVAVGGTAGKTTTTSMIAVALEHCGADPSYAIGGDLAATGQNAHHGAGEVFVAEADESDGSFLRYGPRVAVVTNVEPDHLDYYPDEAAVAAAFVNFCATVSPGGLIVACQDDAGARDMMRSAAATAQEQGTSILSYGLAAEADVRISQVAPAGDGMTATITDAHGALPLTLQVPGLHNVLNATAAFIAVTGLGYPREQALAGLAAFTGARRRFEERGVADGVRVIDDYAHHPAKVSALLKGARTVAGDGQVIVCFQPHLFSRTRHFAADFGTALGLADRVVVMDIFAAREDPEPGVTGELVSAAVPLPAGQVTFEPDRDAAVQQVVQAARPGDLILTVGAGDVTALGPQILAALNARAAAEAGRGQ